MAFLDFKGLSRFLDKLKTIFASKSIFSRSADGLVPHPSTVTNTHYLREDGSWEVPPDTKYTPASLGFGFGICSTSTGIAEKSVTLANYEQVQGGIIAVRFTYDVLENAKLKVNSKIAANIVHRGTYIKSGIIKSGDIAIFVYDGNSYQLAAIDPYRLAELETHAIQDSN